MKYSKEVKVGIIVVVALTALYFGFNFLKGIDVLSEKRTYYAIYPRVDGLSTDNPVQLNGYKIGQVTAIKLMEDNSGRILVTFDITEKGLKVPINSTALIASLDLFNSKAISIKRGDSPIQAETGDTLLSEIEGDLKAEVDKRLRPLEQKTEDLISSIDSVVTIVTTILNEDARQNLTESFESINRSFQSLETTTKRLDTIIVNEQAKISNILTNVNSIATNFEKNNDELTRVIKNFSQISDSIAAANLVETINNASMAMEQVASVMNKIDSGEGTVGQLVNNDTLYYNLEQATLELDKLLEDMRVNPKRYVHFSVFGRSEKPEQKPNKKERPE